MPMYGGQYTITNAATSLTTILTALDAKFPAGGTQIKELHLITGGTATQFVYVGRSNVTNAPANAFALVGPVTSGGGAVSTQIYGHADAYWEHTNNIFIVGTAGAAEILLIMVIT
jgi:hypothetical protein